MDLDQKTFQEVKSLASPNKAGMEEGYLQMQDLKDNWQMDMHHERNDVLILWLFAKEHHALPQFLQLSVKN